MNRLVWLTDIHLNFVPRDDVVRFLLRVAEHEPAALLLTGDIAESHDVCRYLAEMAEAIACPLYFVLGNHDFYHSSIAAVRRDVGQLCRRYGNLHYLTEGGVFTLAPGVGLLGHDGWADARYGDYLRSYVMMHDYRLIEELARRDKLSRLEVLHRLGDEAADAIRQTLPRALEQHDHVYFLTHVPPLLEACWHEGHISDPQWSPHFTCRAMGEALLDIMSDHPTRRLTVLCGHTHGSGETHPLENLTIYTGGAEYGRPDVVKVIELP